MKVSVIVPALNEERCLPHLLNSLAAQDYAGWYEVVVVDNGSSDGTADVARQLGARVVPCSRKGVVFARQAGFDAAQGDIIAHADADNIVPTDWLSRIAHHFAEHPKDVAVCGVVAYLKEPLWHYPLSLFSRLLNSIHYAVLHRPFSILAANFAFRREALAEAGGYNTDLPQFGDEQDLLDRMARVGHVALDTTLVVKTSSRRFKGRLFQSVIGDNFSKTVVPLLLYKALGKIPSVQRDDIRVERSARLSMAMTAVLVISTVLVSTALYAYFVPTSSFFGKVYASAKTSEKVVALTFDDGPNEPFSSQILDILDSEGVKATFFVVGENAAYYPNTVRRIVREGHVLGNHAWSHSRVPMLLDPRYKELARAQKTLTDLTGANPTLFRPPYGQKTPWQLWEVKHERMVAVAWTVSANDPKQPSPEVIAQRVVSKARPGAIILLHDGGNTLHGANRANTVAALPMIIQGLRDKGYTFLTVPQLLKVQPYLSAGGGA